MEVDRVNELMAKLRRYTDWFELLAPKADPTREKAGRAAGCGGARLLTVVPGLSGDRREGYVPVAFVFTGKTAAQPESRMRYLEWSARRYFAAPPAPVGSVHGRRRPLGPVSSITSGAR